MTATLPETVRYSRWEKATRYYALRMQQDLFGHWLLTRSWGRRGSALGQIRHELCNDATEAQSRYDQAAVRRGQRGYTKIAEQVYIRG